MDANTREIKLQELGRRLVEREVSHCVSTLVYDLARNYGAELPEGISDLAEEAFELSTPVPDYEEAASQAGWSIDGALFVNHDDETTASDASPDDACGWEDLCREFDIDTEDYQSEVYEHWIISDWLRRKLGERNERVGDLAGLDVWGRTCTGQAICLDRVIQEIAVELWGDELKDSAA